MKLTFAQDIFRLAPGDMVPRGDLFRLIQFSKQENSDHWDGPAGRINNTPQQGINWIGTPPDVQGVIIKTLPGSYEHDGWIDEGKGAYRYSFKARKDLINHGETANRVLIEQPMQLYPVFLFIKAKSDLRFEGRFEVTEISERFVVLQRDASTGETSVERVDPVWREGQRRYVTHLLAERSWAVVDQLKRIGEWVCDICEENTMATYGVPVIDAHHRTPLAVWHADHLVTTDDIVLVCPNCHRAVHALMRQGQAGYDEVRLRIRERLRTTNQLSQLDMID